jgi:hypothetical protein
MHIAASKKLLFFVFVFFLIINILSGGGHLDWSDGVVTFLVAESMVLKNSAKLHPDTPGISALYGQYDEAQLKSYGPHYTNRALILAAISVPFYYVAYYLSISPVLLVAFVNPLIITLTALVIFLFSLELYGSKRIALLLGIIFTVCSFILPYNTTLFPQPLQALFLVSSAYFIYKSRHLDSSSLCNYYYAAAQNNKQSAIITIKRRGTYFAVLGGLFLGLSVLAHPTSIIAIPGFLVFSFFCMKRSKRKMFFFVMALTIMLLVAVLLNYVRFGSLTEFGYNRYASVFSSNQGWVGLVGLWASPGAGLILFFPLVILLPLAFKYMYRKDKSLLFLITYIIFANWLYFGTLSYLEPISWSGGIVWGPRYLISILPFITIAFGYLFRHLRNKKHEISLIKVSIIILLCLTGFVINLSGTLVWIYYYYLYTWDRGQIGTYGADRAWDLQTWNLNYSPVVLNVKILAEDYIPDIWMELYNETRWHYVTYGLVPCSYDIYLYCKFGLVPVLLLSVTLGILSILIIKGDRVKLLFPKPSLVRFKDALEKSKTN